MKEVLSSVRNLSLLRPILVYSIRNSCWNLRLINFPTDPASAALMTRGCNVLSSWGRTWTFEYHSGTKSPVAIRLAAAARMHQGAVGENHLGGSVTTHQGASRCRGIPPVLRVHEVRPDPPFCASLVRKEYVYSSGQVKRIRIRLDSVKCMLCLAYPAFSHKHNRRTNATPGELKCSSISFVQVSTFWKRLAPLRVTE